MPTAPEPCRRCTGRRSGIASVPSRSFVPSRHCSVCFQLMGASASVSVRSLARNGPNALCRTPPLGLTTLGVAMLDGTLLLRSPPAGEPCSDSVDEGWDGSAAGVAAGAAAAALASSAPTCCAFCFANSSARRRRRAAAASAQTAATPQAVGHILVLDHYAACSVSSRM